MDCDFAAGRSDALWFANFTYVLTGSGTACVSFVIDAFLPVDCRLEADTR